VTLAKAIALVVLAGIWLFIGLLAAFFTMPLWGMSYSYPWPWWIVVACAIWFASYCAIAVQVIRSKKSS